MNLGKAREYYSAYYEGNLDRGLREGFERVLREDAQAQAEYRAFEGTMRQLESMKSQDVETPDDLHERIMSRIDRHIWEKNQTRKSPGITWWKIALPLGIAASVIALAFVPWRSQNMPVNQSGIVPTMTTQARLDVKASPQGVVLSYPTVDQREVVIRDAKGIILETLRLQNQGIKNKELKNESPQTILLSIDESNLGTTWLAIPGSDSNLTSTGKGTIKDMAMEIATACRVPVVLQMKSADMVVEWKLDESDAHGTATRALESSELKVELRGDRSDVRTLWILGN